MSTTVDERVVSMRFDNKNFEANVAQTMKSLQKLKGDLDLKETAKGFEALERAANDVSLDSLEKSASAVEVKFSAMSIACIAAINRIVDQAMSAGEKIIKSLTIDQITSGFDKYEQKMTSVQTIMNATGESIETVNGYLDKLMWYTDETSYSFTDMVNNIGRFTSNQVNLEDATTAMMGIANAAGLSGASVTDATHAMDGFAKAIGQGYLQRQHWDWIQTAHMDTTQMKQSLIDAAVAVGTLTAAGEGLWQTLEGTTVTIGDFESAMSEGWISRDVMISAFKSMGEFSDAVYELYEDGMLTSEAMEQLSGTLGEISEKGFRAS